MSPRRTATRRACVPTSTGQQVAEPAAGQESFGGHVGACPYESRGFQADHGGVQAHRVVANTALGVVLTGGALSLVAGIASPLTARELMNGFVVSNTLLGLSFSLAGYPIARARPDNLVGWLLLAAGISYLFSGVG